MMEAPRPNIDSARKPRFRPLTPLSVVLIALVLAVVGGGSFLLSAAESTTLVDGAVAWKVTSPLRAVVQLLCLNYAVPTLNAGDVKMLILGVGAGVAALVLAVGALARSSESLSPALPVAQPSDRARGGQPWLGIAQGLVLGYLAWSLLSGRWSDAPELALGTSLLLAIQFLWAFALGWGLSARGARIATRLLVPIGVITALLAVWYFYGRNPNLRAKFPFGNPTFLAACLIPGIVIGLAVAMEGVQRARRVHAAGGLGMAIASLAGVGLMLWAFLLAQSRGAMLGLGAALAAIVVFSARGAWRWIASAGAIGLVVAGGLYFASAGGDLHGRSASTRLRLHAWEYALAMFEEHPVLGYGQGGFVLKGDSFVPQDILTDPEAFQGRLAHVHNEWLEVLADLGIIGLLLIGMSLVFSLIAGLRTADASRQGKATNRRSPLADNTVAPESPDAAAEAASAGAASTAAARHVVNGPALDWPMIAAMAALVGLIVDAAFGVGLRVSGVPVWFYTLLGLIWGMSSGGSATMLDRLASRSGARLATAAVGGVAGLLAMVLSQQDFAAARKSYEVEQRLDEGNFEEAVELAAGAVYRLNAQRGLTALYRLAEAHMLVARKLQGRAVDRESRAQDAGALEASRLLQLAGGDRDAAAFHCAEASAALIELVARAPGFLNQGRVEYEINLILADNAAARGDRKQFALAMENAHAAIERELRRQPFNPEVAYDFVRSSDQDTPPLEVAVVLARPLRYNMIGPDHVDAINGLSGQTEFEKEMTELAGRAVTHVEELVQTPSGETVQESPAETEAPDTEAGAEGSRLARSWPRWTPEILRFVAAMKFFKGEYDVAASLQRSALEAYAKLGLTTLGRAAGFAELADSLFFSNPLEIGPVLEAAQQAEESAPPSLPGRNLVKAVEERRITYELAGGNEDRGMASLRGLAPPGVPEAALKQELGRRYRMMCESILRRREAVMLRRPANELIPRMKQWIARSLELSPDDPVTYYLAADLAFHEGEDEVAADNLMRSMDRGLAPEAALQFIDVALERKPDSAAMKSLKDVLVKRLSPPEEEPLPEAQRPAAPKLTPPG
ncbi:MAG: O-antigen ligase family protein [Phycisphaerae bacterium]|nr:O-antigen ligase family protein [Phycisphaerae bacterium]